MKRLMIFILAAFVSCGALAQTSQPASKASIEQLLEITETKQMYEATMQEMTKMVDQSTARIMNRIPPEKQGKFKKAMAQLDTIIKEEMSWDKMKSQYVQIYMETFTQQEIDDLAAFYQTPSGKSFIKKQPLVIQRTSAISQEKMGVMMERFSNMMQQVMAE
ncbi:DUF2059 domain-containing protein [Oxalobacter vibrioformis]|uniref:DUF2059 domain-containing protein n=1 Tax=Oxalobacter vibrioformis TaxID=933080 RepID=A0A9E9P3D0_9BURK|nr:DUF2059 domain-containing protein [Oxalobacter vibrioformis]WAW10874.1 DUF2059 domain-containing protein [Oxalobacter vibrioformis]